jgi:PhnB protein
MAQAKQAVPEGYHTVTASLTLDDAKAAMAWYGQALGAEELARSVGPGGEIMHAELRIGDSRVMVNDAVMGGKGPKAFGGSPASLWVYVEDCDKLYDRAVAAGATVSMPMADMFWGDRFGAVVDPFGYRWSFATRKEDLTPAEIAVREAAFYKEFAAQGGKP